MLFSAASFVITRNGKLLLNSVTGTQLMSILFSSSSLILIFRFQIYKPVLHRIVITIKWDKTFICSTQLLFTSNHDFLKWYNVKVLTHGKHLLKQNKANKKWLEIGKLKKRKLSFLPGFHGCFPNGSDGNKPDCKPGIFPMISKQITKSRLWQHFS